MDDPTSWVLVFRYTVELIAIVTAFAIAISTLDDVYIDLCYWFLTTTSRNKWHLESISNSDLLEAAPEQPLAILVPAWQEHEVIFSMLAANAQVVRYSNYHYFVGAYRNDEPTILEIERARRSQPNIHLVVVPRDGPTSKADCLNEIVAAVFMHEAKHKMRFSGVALHDAEDLIHPQELQLFNLLVVRSDFIQLPVFSFNRPLTDLIGGIYMDEFAEVHTKDLVVRNYLSGVIPCAGVSACFSRDALAMLADFNKGAVFRTSSFTEDYDIAFRVHDLGLRTTFVSFAVGYNIDIVDGTGGPAVVRRSLPIATREFFPSNFAAAVRQRARWLIGIVFQGTSQLGWKGGLGTRYFLARDRKSIVTNLIVIVGYFVLVSLTLIELYFYFASVLGAPPYEYLVSRLVVSVFVLNVVLLLWRLTHRMFFTAKIYNWRQGLMAGPRVVVANFVNFFATLRAIRIYIVHRVAAKALIWDKTIHTYPFVLDQQGWPRENAESSATRAD